MGSCTTLTTVTGRSTSARTVLPSTRSSSPFPLKPLPDNGYDPRQCAAEGCDRPSDVIDGTHRFWDGDVPLCDDCNALRPDPEMSTSRQAALDILIEEEEEPDEPKSVTVVNPRSFKLFG